MHVYTCTWEHIVSLSYRTDLWIFMIQVLLLFGQIRPGADPGRGKNMSQGGGGGGSPSSMNFFFRPEGYSNKLNA